jgi:hypothetical protein
MAAAIGNGGLMPKFYGTRLPSIAAFFCSAGSI